MIRKKNEILFSRHISLTIMTKNRQTKHEHTRENGFIRV